MPHALKYYWHRLLVRLGFRAPAVLLTPQVIARIALANLGNNLVLNRALLRRVKDGMAER